MNQNKSSISMIHLKVWHSPAGLLIQGVGALKIWQRCSRILPGNTWTTREAHTCFTPPVSGSNQYTVLFCQRKYSILHFSYLAASVLLSSSKDGHYLSRITGGKKESPHTPTNTTYCRCVCVCVVFGRWACVFSFLDEIKGREINFSTSSGRDLEVVIDSSLVFGR